MLFRRMAGVFGSVIKAGPKGQNHSNLPELPAGDADWFEAVTGTTLYAWQREELTKLMTPDRPNTYYLQMARKNGKSYFAAAMVICQARRPDQHIYVVSDSERNLNSALMREIRDIIRRSAVLSAAFVEFANKIEVPSTNSFIESRPNKFAASQSINPHLAVVDEVHLQRDLETWGGYQQSCAAHPDGMVLGITTPGQDVAGPAHTLYLKVRDGLMDGRIWEPHSPSTAYMDRAEWSRANPRLVDDPTFLGRLEQDHSGKGALPEYQFKRYRLGMWTAGATAWLPYGAWDGLRAPQSLLYGDPVWLGFDGSLSGDSTALVACSATGHLTVLGSWASTGKAWRVPVQEVIDAVHQAYTDYDVRMLYADPPFWKREVQEWERAYPDRVEGFLTSSAAKMGPACENFRRAVSTQRISHDGDPVLSRHISNAVVRETPYGECIQKPTKDSPAKVDLAVASVLAYAAHGASPSVRKTIGVF